MKRLILILYCFLLAHLTWGGIHTYTTESALSKGTIIKIRVNETGVHMIPYDSLKQWGLNPNHVSILGYGGRMLSENFTHKHFDDLPPVSIYIHKGDDNLFNSGDYILFYAQSAVQWKTDNNGFWRHIQNPYSNYGYYFVTDNLSLQRTITLAQDQYNLDNIEDVDWYNAYYLHEQDLVNLIDVTGANGGGREFYGEAMNLKNSTLSIALPTQHACMDMKAHCNIQFAASSGENTITSLRVNYAGKTEIKKVKGITDEHAKARLDSIILDVNPVSATEQKMNITFNGATSNASAYLNYIELNIPCSLIMTGDEMLINNRPVSTNKPVIRYHLRGTTPQTHIWRINDGVHIEKMPTEYHNNILTWVGDNTSVEQYIAINTSSSVWKKPVTIGRVSNQNLHQLENIDYVIICPSKFISPARHLAKKHEEVDHLTWAVVTDEQVYNEFSSGTPDASAYRWFMKMLYDRANGDPIKAPKNLLLMGDGTYDNRQIFRAAVSGENTLLTYQAKNSTIETSAYATDDYFGFLTDEAGVKQGVFSDRRATMNIGVGRLPVKTLEEAEQVVNKICAYIDDKLLGKWKSQILFLADDGNHGAHVETAEEGAKIIQKQNKDFVLNKIYLDAHTQEVNAAGESYPIAKNQFDNLMNNGVLFMNYSGHGGYNNITNELFLRTNDIRRMTNKNQAFWFLATCSFSHFDGGISSAGEEAVLNPNGGAIAVLSACRTVFVGQNTKLNGSFCDTILGHKTPFDYHITIGEATRVAKNKLTDDENKLPYILLGDPALRLNYPTNYQVKTTQTFDTIQALTTQTLKGYIQAPNYDTAYWFNGKLDVTIFDKIQNITTRDNDELVEENKKHITYTDYPNTLFIGQTDIKDGKFEITFMVPKDIRYNYGKGRIVYYAYDDANLEEAIGHFEDFTIGGTSSVVVQDTLGPELNIYINNPYFIDGQQTHEYPHFYAEIYDENGINTAGAGIGHDLLMVIDDDSKQTYVLNSYYQGINNSYQSGIVSYKMAEQQEGHHTLTFRAWDLCNNSSTASLNFQVVKGFQPQLYSVIAYPNPVTSTGVLHISVEHDRPDDIVEYTMNLYNLNGQLIHTHTQYDNHIQWNMADLNTPTGIYIYQLTIKTPSSNYISKAGKLIITQ
jgi:hypothetical protein